MSFASSLVVRTASFLFVLLRNAGHNGNYEHILGDNSFLLGVIRLKNRAEHFVRRFAGRKVRKKISVVIFRVINPAGRTGSYHRENALIRNSVQKFGRFFHNCKVRAEIRVEHFFEA